MKKLIAAMAVCACLALAGCGGSSAPSSSTVPESSSTAEEQAAAYDATYDAGTVQGDIEGVVASRILDKMADTAIDSVAINADASNDGKYIVLVNLTWNVKNSAETSKKMLAMYSEDLAATLANECPDVSEVAVFWTVPELGATAKVSYASNGTGMMLADEVWNGFDK